MKNPIITYKKVKSTAREHSHTNVYLNDRYIGYYMANKNGLAATESENWNWCPYRIYVASFYTPTQQALIKKLEQLIIEHIKLNKKSFFFKQ